MSDNPDRSAEVARWRRTNGGEISAQELAAAQQAFSVLLQVWWSQKGSPKT
jgi:hypothetical protein